MSDSAFGHRNGRRGFIKLCMGALTLGRISRSIAEGAPAARPYNAVDLVDPYKKPIAASSLVVGRSYVFHYPYISTPCFLIDLGAPLDHTVELITETGDTYEWHGGVGPNSSIVAFSAICAHKMTHPSKSVSFINYRHGKTRFQDKSQNAREGSGLIYCCSERSVYDAGNGARVLGGPAGQPLTSILLEYDHTAGNLRAVGTAGGEMYDRFFEEFTPRLQLEYRTTDVNRLVSGYSEVAPIEEFSKINMTC